FHAGESSVTSELRHVLRTLGIIASFGGDGGESDPVLEALYVRIMELRYLWQHGLEIRAVCAEGKYWQRCDSARGKRSVDEFTTICRLLGWVSHASSSEDQLVIFTAELKLICRPVQSQ